MSQMTLSFPPSTGIGVAVFTENLSPTSSATTATWPEVTRSQEVPPLVRPYRRVVTCRPLGDQLLAPDPGVEHRVGIELKKQG